MSRALELFAGIGGFSAACEGYEIEVVAACDASSHVLEVFEANFDAPTYQLNLESADAETLGAFDADLWWMSPPCQPYTIRGKREDLDDPRALSFKRVLEAFAEVKPEALGVENVEGFADSRARDLLVTVLRTHGYQWTERVLCPSEFGIPNRRPRYYLAASLQGVSPIESHGHGGGMLLDYIDNSPDHQLAVPPAKLEKYGDGFHIVDAEDRDALSAVFTGAYSKSWVYSGSYLEQNDQIRFFSHAEIARLHGLPQPFVWPEHTGRRQRYKYLGNSLSIEPVRAVLRALAVPRVHASDASSQGR